MGDSTIMLAMHDFTPKRLNFPVIVTEKIDGVAADFFGTETGFPSVRTRQDKPLHSVNHILEWLTGRLNAFEHMVGELHIAGMVFKDAGGLIRSHDNVPEVVLHVYDFYVEGREDSTYQERMTHAAKVLLKYVEEDSPVQIIPALGRFDDLESLEAFIKQWMIDNPDAEGVVIRSLEGEDSFYRAGKRSYGMQPRKRVETLDLVLHSVEEAIDKKTKKGNGMAGRLNVWYNGKVSGVGPGALTHKERKELLTNKEKYPDGRTVIEVSYKPDESYEGLREGHFVRFRPELNEHT